MFKQNRILNGLKDWYRSLLAPSRRPCQPIRRSQALKVEALEERALMTAGLFFSVVDSTPPAAASPQPVLMVLSNQDFWYQDYSETRNALIDAGLRVEVAADTMNQCVPHAGSGQGDDGGIVTPERTLAEVDAGDYSAVVFVGGWGASSYQYAFEGTYSQSAYNGTFESRAEVNRLINDFVDQDKYVTALCTGVTVLAWARVDGQSPLEGRTVTGYAGWMPDSTSASGAYQGYQLASWHVENNGATMLRSGAIGDPSTSADDVWVDGKIITAEDWRAGYAMGQTLAERLIAEARENTPASAEPRHVLMVIGNADFFYREYAEPRQALAEAGFVVEVAAANAGACYPHAGTGEGSDGGLVMADFALADVDSARYEAIVFVGGWGASQYQYAYSGTYDNSYYNGASELKQIVNELINDFVDQDKYVAAICHGVSVLAWARVDGTSLLDGVTVAGHARGAPAGTYEGVHYGYFEQTNDWHIQTNGGVVLPSGSVGDTSTTADDVWVDGKIITAENDEAAHRFGEVLVEELR